MHYIQLSYFFLTLHVCKQFKTKQIFKWKLIVHFGKTLFALLRVICQNTRGVLAWRQYLRLKKEDIDTGRKQKGLRTYITY